jgi:RNA polymerase sigma factor (sigma-70 family)
MLEIDTKETYTDEAPEAPSQPRSLLIFEREQLFAGVRPRLLRLARLRGVMPDVLEDVVQETLLVAWRQLDRLQSPEHFQRWVDEICRRICHRFVRSHYRDASRQIQLFDPSLDNNPGELEEALRAGSTGVESLDPAEVLCRYDLTLLLERALGSLPANARKALELYYVLELSQREAAVRLGLSISALETRLYRARRQLRQVLSGALRAEAVSLGLPLDEEPASGWAQTRLWCYYCGHQHLHRTFESAPDGHLYLRMRCPECSRRFDSDIVNGKGMVQVDGLRSFQPAFKRTMRGVSRYLLGGIAAGELSCVQCGKPAPVRVSELGEEKAISSGPYLRQFWVSGVCPHCGSKVGGASADDAVYWSHSVTQQFIQRYPRWLNEPDTPIEYDGQPAILFRLCDTLGAARLHVITHRETLQVLATFQE